MSALKQYKSLNSFDELEHYTDWVGQGDCYILKEIRQTGHREVGSIIPELRLIGSNRFGQPIHHFKKFRDSAICANSYFTITPVQTHMAYIYGLSKGLHFWDGSNVFIPFGEINESTVFTYHDNGLVLSNRESGQFDQEAFALMNPVRYGSKRPLSSPSVLGQISFVEPVAEIETAIEEASDLPLLPDNWNEEGAKAISTELFDNAVNFLRTYNKFLGTTYKVSLPAPEINPCPDGSIDLSWRSKHARMLINIRIHDNIPHAFFYGDRYNNKMPVKGNTPVADFSEGLAAWMKSLTS